MPEIHNTDIPTPDKFKAELVFEYLKDFILNTEKNKISFCFRLTTKGRP